MILPADFAASVLIIERVGDTELRIRKGRTVRQRKYTLRQLLEGVTDATKHPAVDGGPPVGKEILPPYPRSNGHFVYCAGMDPIGSSSLAPSRRRPTRRT